MVNDFRLLTQTRVSSPDKLTRASYTQGARTLAQAQGRFHLTLRVKKDFTDLCIYLKKKSARKILNISAFEWSDQ